MKLESASHSMLFKCFLLNKLALMAVILVECYE